MGITGSIAAYKSAELVRLLSRQGVEVRCALSESARHFVAPLTLAVLSRHPVAQNLHDPSLWDMAHLSLAGWAEMILIAPATADFIARLASGRAEGLLDSLVLSARVPIVVCPAMDCEMWEHKATQANVARLKDLGYHLWGPERGELASGKKGWGRFMEPADIARKVGQWRLKG